MAPAVSTDTKLGRVRRSAIWRDIALFALASTLTLSAAYFVIWATPAERRSTLTDLGKNFIESLHFLLPAAVGLLILANESRLKRELHEDQLRLNREIFEAEREALRSEADNLRGLSNKLAAMVTAKMSTDTHWASEALERAKLGGFGKTLFGERVGHFTAEKEQLAEQFLPLLLERCHHLLNSGKRHIYLLIDSGTTLYPLFQQLGRAAVRLRENQQNWIDGVRIVTNNLPGMESLMDVGRRNPNNRYSDLAINCQLLPGVPLPVYSAVTGELATAALADLKAGADTEHDVFIAIVTGNWIRVRRTPPLCPIPLARGTGHREFKQALIDCSDEIYVVGSLGKLFIEQPLEDVNRALDLDEKHVDPEKQPYGEVNITDVVARQVKLVTTSRAAGRVLHPLSDRVQWALSYAGDRELQRFPNAIMPDVPHLFFPFSPRLANWYEELRMEFPHEATRRAGVPEKYFYVQTPEPLRGDES